MAEIQTTEQRWQAATDRATKQFAETHRLHVRRDECNDQIIPGRRGHLYFDGEVLCLMVLDGECAEKQRWEELGGQLWLGDKSMGANGRNQQDVKIHGVTNPKAAIRMCRITPVKVLSEIQRRNLDSGRVKFQKKSNPLAAE